MMTESIGLHEHISAIDAFQNMMSYWTDNYVRFASVMEKHGYAWEAVKVHTEDGYTLTTFHVTGKVAPDGTTILRNEGGGE